MPGDVLRPRRQHQVFRVIPLNRTIVGGEHSQLNVLGRKSPERLTLFLQTAKREKLYPGRQLIEGLFSPHSSLIADKIVQSRMSAPPDVDPV